MTLPPPSPTPHARGLRRPARPEGARDARARAREPAPIGVMGAFGWGLLLGFVILAAQVAGIVFALVVGGVIGHAASGGPRSARTPLPLVAVLYAVSSLLLPTAFLVGMAGKSSVVWPVLGAGFAMLAGACLLGGLWMRIATARKVAFPVHRVRRSG